MERETRISQPFMHCLGCTFGLQLYDASNSACRPKCRRRILSSCFWRGELRMWWLVDASWSKATYY